MAPPSMLEYALRYRRRGFSVIPCKRDKKPYLKSWQTYQTVKPTEEEIRFWWKEHPDANIAIICGPVSGLDVLDCDSQEAYDNLNEFYLNDSFRTPTVKTPNGRHVYFKHQQGLSNAVRAIKGTDIRTHGGYVIAPPSRNGSDTSYYWLDGLTPKDCAFSEWPPELFAALQAIGQAQYRKDVAPVSKDTHTDIGDLFTSGRRDNDLFHIVNALTKGGCEDHFKQTVLEILAKNCTPPFPIEEIATKLKSAADRESKRHGDVLRAVECYIDEDETGTFSIRDCYENLLNRNAGVVERETVRKTLARFAREKTKIVADSTRRGWYRKIRQVREEIDFANATSQYLKLYLPFHLEDEVRISPGNIIVISGVTNMGKTTVALDMIAHNMKSYEIHYFNDEMEGGELRDRLNLFEDIAGGPKAWKMKSWRLPDFDEIPDVLVPGKGVLNFLDYIDPPAEKSYVIKDMMKRIHKKLDGAVAIICLQLKPGAEAPVGGWGAIHRSRLAINIERNVVKVIKAKARTRYEYDINGLKKNFDIIGGWRIVEQSKWIA